MRLIDFCLDKEPSRLGVVIGDVVVDVGGGALSDWIEGSPGRWDSLRRLAQSASQQLPTNASEVGIHDQVYRVLGLSDVRLRPPVSRPCSIRDFYAFEQHVKTANENRGRDVPPEWYQAPVFYFTNPRALYGNGDIIPYPQGSEALDYELEVAAVIGKEGRNIKAEDAEDYILGYMIYNDWSARDLQRVEMRVGLGPAKGKDFAQSFGPMLVTADELRDHHTGRVGVYDLAMIARVNGVERSRGNWRDIHYSFGDIIAHASRDATLYPNDIIGSGTVGTGCLLETTKGQGAYLKAGDVVELEIEGLGVLMNIVGESQKAL